MRFHEKLQLLLAARGLTQADLARSLRKNTTRINAWYHGPVLPRLGDGIKIARVLGVPLDYLADDSQDEPPPPPPDVLAAPATLVPVVPPVGPVDEACILRIAHELGPDEALRRLLGPESRPAKD